MRLLALLLVLLALPAGADILRATTTSTGITEAYFTIDGVVVPGAVSIAPNPTDIGTLVTQTVGPPWPSLPYTVQVEVCNVEECSMADQALVVTEAPPSRAGPPLQQPVIKSCTDASPGFTRCQWKARDGDTGAVIDLWEIRRQFEGEWLPITSQRIPTTGIPSNETVSQIEGPPGCHEYRLHVEGEGNAPSPLSAVVTHGACLLAPPVACDWDLSGNGVVDLADLGTVLWGLGSTYNLTDVGALLGALGTDCQ